MLGELEMFSQTAELTLIHDYKFFPNFYQAQHYVIASTNLFNVMRWCVWNADVCLTEKGKKKPSMINKCILFQIQFNLTILNCHAKKKYNLK